MITSRIARTPGADLEINNNDQSTEKETGCGRKKECVTEYHLMIACVGSLLSFMRELLFSSADTNGAPESRCGRYLCLGEDGVIRTCTYHALMLL